jgi:WD40 repeat protein
VHFSPSGDLLASQAWDGTTRFWEVSSGEQLLRTEAPRLLESSFSHPDGRFLGMHDLDHFHLWEVTRDIPMKVFRSPSGETRRWSVDIDLTGRWLASAKDDGVEIWDIHRGKVVNFLPAIQRDDGTSKDARFLPDGRALLTSNTNGLRIYPIEPPSDSGTTEPRLLDPQTLHAPQASWISLTANGVIVAFRDHVHGSRGVLVNLPDPSDRVVVGPHPGMDHVEISPDGRWVATTTWGGAGIHVWDAQTGSRVTPQGLEPSESKTNAVFSPDSKHLAASTPKHHTAWRVGTWETVFRVPRHVQDDWPGPLAYSPDGMLLAAAHSRFELTLLNVRTGSEIAVVTAPGSAGFHDCCFSRDGRLLAAASDTNIHLWDLAQIRQQLAQVNLDF